MSTTKAAIPSGTNIDPLGPLGLLAKYEKALQKGKITAIRLVFRAEGAIAQGQLPHEGEGEGKWIPLSEAMASASQEEERPFEDEKSHLCAKYEKRLDEEAPAAMRSASTKVELEAAVATVAFAKRKALLMSNKEFDISYLRWENGTAVPRPADEADALKRASVAGRGNNRGRGRGGRGRGSFRGAQAPPQAPQQAGN